MLHVHLIVETGPLFRICRPNLGLSTRLGILRLTILRLAIMTLARVAEVNT